VIASAIEAVVEPRELTPANVDPQRARATDDAVISESKQGTSKLTRRPRHKKTPQRRRRCEDKEHVLLKMNELDAGSGVPSTV